jgi:hypothetical protein
MLVAAKKMPTSILMEIMVIWPTASTFYFALTRSPDAFDVSRSAYPASG